MNEIAQAKTQIRLRNWQVMYQSYVESGQTVSRWCAENSVKPKTFYYRLKRLREEALRQEQHDIVAVNTSENTVSAINTGVIRITGRGITAELPQDISAELLTVLLKGLSSC